MSDIEAKRTDRMHDEHQAPREGIEQEIMGFLGETEIHSASNLVLKLKEKDFRESDILGSVWSLVDRGFIELTVDRKLKGHKDPIYPAPSDIL